jgi:hypothetical protein
MKKILFTILILNTLSIFANSAFECEWGNETIIVKEDDQRNNKPRYYKFIRECDLEILHGDICFTGSIEGAKDILRDFSKSSLFSHDHDLDTSITISDESGNNRIDFELYEHHGWDEVITLLNTSIYRCQ